MITASTKYPAETHVLNLKTNRYVLRDSKVGQKLIKEYERAQIEAELPPTESKVKPKPQQQPQEDNVVKATPSDAEFKRAMSDTLTDIVAENKHKLSKKMTQKQTEKLLRKMLYEKLCVDKKEKKNKAKVKTKAKAKKKFRIATPPQSSASESSDSDSSSDSD